MALCLRKLAIALLILPATAFAQTDFGSFTPILSALQDASNTDGSSTQYHGFFDHVGSGSDLYINSVQLVEGTNWDTDIDLFIPDTGFAYNFGSFYEFGTPISGDQNWFLNNIASRSGDIVDVDEGIYDFSVEYLGGDSDTAMDVLGSIDFELHVLSAMDVVASGVGEPDSIHAGQQSTVMLTITNNMTAHTFITSSLYFVNGGMEQGSNSLQFQNFILDWFDHDLAPGQSGTHGHTIWGATASTPLGTYVGNMGLSGGIYDGDNHSFVMNPAPTIQVVPVPEPSTIAVLGLASAALLRRRKKEVSG